MVERKDLRIHVRRVEVVEQLESGLEGGNELDKRTC